MSFLRPPPTSTFPLFFKQILPNEETYITIIKFLKKQRIHSHDSHDTKYSLSSSYILSAMLCGSQPLPVVVSTSSGLIIEGLRFEPVPISLKYKNRRSD
ncbi:hypothetical protein HanRHA438_Chr14g0634541 [Helianthus annuus]|nr:hypothetical protein HanHA89_Chr14g0543241 [Helianthus annuus]KAJ0654914.1 hypothetical protein HanLR1_Chr14g0512511 [Helianthus annuus]KAJ0658642.1 hypothetical protein HanOQP8_Chr14g0510531 [Helianthus annuus]KAJ0852118.1 hypothetical protein HanRHA438_Chr14g0634541 [Helianthus annuus]